MIKPEIISKINSILKDLKVDKHYKLIKANLERVRSVEATYRCFEGNREDYEVAFSIPRYYMQEENPIDDIKALSSICKNIVLNSKYSLERLRISDEKIKAEYFNNFDSTTMKVTIPKNSIID